jgi:thioredoxin-related protein
MPHRRKLLAALATLPLAARAAPVATDYGFTQDWIEDSFLHLAEELAEAAAAGRRLAVIVEQRGCPYCREMHHDHLAQPAIEQYLRRHFRLVQLEMHGARQATDLDGQAMEERALVRRWQVRFTPSIVFAPEQAGARGEVARMHGLLPKPQFLGMFRYVVERGYADGTAFPAWWARHGQ